MIRNFLTVSLLTTLALLAMPVAELTNIDVAYDAGEVSDSAWSLGGALQRWEITGEEIYSRNACTSAGAYTRQAELVHAGSSSADCALANNLCDVGGVNYWGLGGHRFRTGGVLFTGSPWITLKLSRACDVHLAAPSDDCQHHLSSVRFFVV
ncbi:MAG: hypothetical protein GY725_09265 [bacterium]|nr:hypothetical protein [bacterium]